MMQESCIVGFKLSKISIVRIIYLAQPLLGDRLNHTNGGFLERKWFACIG